MHDLGFAPIRDVALDIEGQSLVHNSAKLEFNLFNLDSEIRKINRNIAGMNFLEVTPEFYKVLEKDGMAILSELSVLSKNKEGHGSEWVNYPGDSHASQFEYYKLIQKAAHKSSRQREQKRMAETEESKLIDFAQPDSVLNGIADRVTVFVEQLIEDIGTRMGSSLIAEVVIGRGFDNESVLKALEAVERIDAMNFGPTFTQLVKADFANVMKRLSPEQQKKITSELEQITNGSDDMSLPDPQIKTGE
jgi:hypothetical protein